jgi:hypothetical protein
MAQKVAAVYYPYAEYPQSVPAMDIYSPWTLKQVQGCPAARAPQEAQKGAIGRVLTKSHTKLPVETLRPAEQPKRACFRIGRKCKKLGFGYVVLLLQTT